MNSPPAFIAGTGVSLPANIVTNEDLSERLGLDPEKIYRASGIRERRWAAKGDSTGNLASAALRAALKDASLNPKDVDYLVLGTMTPDRMIPGTAPAVQQALAMREIPCLDIRGACCNALYGLQVAQALIASGIAHCVAVCLVDVQSPWLDLSARSGTISMLFGDSAATLMVMGEKRPNSLEILDILLATDGSYVDDLGIRRPGTEFGAAAGPLSEAEVFDYLPRMAGQSVILQASRRMAAACQNVLARNGKTIQEVRWIVPHQANANLLSQLARMLSLTSTEGVISVLEHMGNTSSASMGIALDTLRRLGAPKTGDYVLLPAFAAGFTWGAGLCRVCEP